MNPTNNSMSTRCISKYKERGQAAKTPSFLLCKLAYHRFLFKACTLLRTKLLEQQACLPPTTFNMYTTNTMLQRTTTYVCYRHNISCALQLNVFSLNNTLDNVLSLYNSIAGKKS